MKDTLTSLNVFLAQQQKERVNTLTEANPLLASIPVKASTHGLYNVFSKVSDIKGMEEVMFDEELPTVSVAYELGTTHLFKIGGKLPMPKDAAEQMGGYKRFAADRMPQIVAESGNRQETRIYYKYLQAYALKNNKLLTAGGTTAGKQFSLMAVTWDPATTIGLYDKNQVGNEQDKGKIFEETVLNGGYEYEIEVDGKKCLGKMMASYMKFGLQMADPRLIGGIVNISLVDNKLPSADMMDDLLAGVRAGTSTVLYCHPALHRRLATKFQFAQRQVTNGVTGVTYNLYTYQDIPFVTSYNISWGEESVLAVS